MELSLSKNIRHFRKERHLTQEQMAEIMGVTPGAVYKWESGQSTPELGLIVEMADFFGTSTDVLIGYQLCGNSAEKTLQEIKQYRGNRQYEEGTSAIQKAIKNYPNHFEIIYECARFFREKAQEAHSRPDYEAALTQYGRACELIGQNNDETVSELSIRKEMAEIHFRLGNMDACMEILKRYNFCGINNARIGCILADCCHQTEEAKTYLQEAVNRLVKDLDSVVIGFTTVFLQSRDFEAILSSIHWLRTVLRGGAPYDRVIWFDKYECVLLAIEAEILCMTGRNARAKQMLTEAAELAKRFDTASPREIGSQELWHKLGVEENHYMSYGQTAMEAAESRVMTDAEVVPKLPVLWRQVKEEVLCS